MADMRHEQNRPASSPVSCLHVSRTARAARIHWSTFVFLIAFTILLVVVARYTLVPGLDAISREDTTPEEKRRLVAWFRLLLFVLLFILFAGIVLTFRFGRLFFPRPTEPRSKTQYIDAWAESGRRMQVPPEGSGDEDEGRE
jgi:hypothetical protein